MNLGVVYCTHQTAGLDLRERLGFGTEQLARAYGALRERFPETEVVLVSTCNRVELYAAAADGERELAAGTPRLPELTRFLSEFHAVPADALAGSLLEERGPDAVRHLFAVASSLDSMVLGEPQITGQIKTAYDAAREHRACGPLTHALFQGAFRTAARVRSETTLSDGRVSIASVAVGEFGRSIFERFDDKRVLIVGSGEMAEETLRYLKHEGAAHVDVVNRSPERAERLAAGHGGTAHPWSELDRLLADADVIITATGAREPILTVDRFAAARRGREGRPVFLLDLGSPRDVSPAVSELDEGVFRYDIDDLEATCAANRRRRRREIDRANRIVAEEADRFARDLLHRATGPVVRRLREEWHAVRDGELDRLFARRPDLAEAGRDDIERAVDRVVNKLLHPPLAALKEEAGRADHAGLLDAMRRLFGLP